MAGKADKIFLASDPDREGEAIAYHTKFLISNDKFLMKKKLEIKRISFHEITKEAVEEALKGAREIDMNLVNAQQGRRVLDRVVGYSLSPVLWKKVRRGLSAGRVQSVAVRLIVEREKEIEVFKKEKFYRVEAWFDQDKKEFRADLFKVGEKSFIKLSKIKLFDGEYSFSKSIFGKEEEVRDFVSSLGTEFEVEKVEGREINKIPHRLLRLLKCNRPPPDVLVGRETNYDFGSEVVRGGTYNLPPDRFGFFVTQGSS